MLYPAELRARAMFMRSFCFLPFRILLLLNGPPTRTPGSNLAWHTSGIAARYPQGCTNLSEAGGDGCPSASTARTTAICSPAFNPRGTRTHSIVVSTGAPPSKVTTYLTGRVPVLGASQQIWSCGRVDSVRLKMARPAPIATNASTPVMIGHRALGNRMLSGCGHGSAIQGSKDW